MPKKISPELEKAILDLPAKEKNKLLLRLIAKSELLIDQLQFRLLEGSAADIDYRVDSIREEFVIMAGIFGASNGRQTLGFFKNISAKINYHKKVTADKLSELRLIIEMLTFTVAKYPLILGNDGSIFAEKFRVLFVKKTIAAIKLLKAVHEDYHIEFVPKLDEVLAFCHEKTYTRYVARGLDLPHEIEE
jgi:hypothetical protein